MCVCSYMCAHTYTCVRVCMYTCVCMCVCVYVRGHSENSHTDLPLPSGMDQFREEPKPQDGKVVKTVQIAVPEVRP